MADGVRGRGGRRRGRGRGARSRRCAGATTPAVTAHGRARCACRFPLMRYRRRRGWRCGCGRRARRRRRGRCAIGYLEKPITGDLQVVGAADGRVWRGRGGGRRRRQDVGVDVGRLDDADRVGVGRSGARGDAPCAGVRLGEFEIEIGVGAAAREVRDHDDARLQAADRRTGRRYLRVPESAARGSRAASAWRRGCVRRATAAHGCRLSLIYMEAPL